MLKITHWSQKNKQAQARKANVKNGQNCDYAVT